LATYFRYLSGFERRLASPKLLPVCEQKGSHRYSQLDYKSMFAKVGFNGERFVAKDSKMQGYVLRKSASTQLF